MNDDFFIKDDDIESPIEDDSININSNFNDGDVVILDQDFNGSQQSFVEQATDGLMLQQESRVQNYEQPKNYRKGVWTEYIYDKINSGEENCLVILTGKKGRGKSTTALAFAERLCERFGRKFDMRFFCHDAHKLLQIMTWKDLPKGSVVIVDELQTISNRRNFYSQINKALNDLFSTFRTLGLIVIFTTPVLNFIDTQIRPHIDAWWVVKSKNREQKTNLVRAYLIEYDENARSEKEQLRKKFLVVKDRQTGDMKEFADIVVSLPSEELRAEYKEFRSKLTRDVIQRSLQRIEVERAKEHKANALGEALSKTQLMVMQLKARGLTNREMADAMGPGFTDMRIRQIMKAVAKKNFGGMLNDSGEIQQPVFEELS